MKYTVHQINLTHEQVDEINGMDEGLAEGLFEEPEYSKRKTATMCSPSQKVIEDAWHAGDYTPACHIEADSLDDVFEIGNIGPEKRIERLGVMHSVSVGDVIEDETGKYHYVAPIGFKPIERGLS